jgi:diaminopimelate decarboxylase
LFYIYRLKYNFMELRNNRYVIQNIDVLDISRDFGTPVYIYDGEKIVHQLHRLQQAFRGVSLKVKYAAKALTNLSVLKLLKSEGAGMDAVSIGEVQLGLAAGYHPREIMYTPNCVSFDEFREAIDLGTAINVDNLPTLIHLGETYGSSVPCCIRLNPHIVAGGNAKIQVGHEYSKFGISIQQLDEILEIIGKYRIVINGLHIHTGSDIQDADVFLQSARLLFEIARHFPDLQFINFGGGFKVAYKSGDKSAEIEKLGSRLTEVFTEFCRMYGRDLELWLEPGKFLVSEAGLLLVQANVVKQTPTTVFVGVNSGLNHLIRPMMYDAYHDVVNISNPGGPLQPYTVVGYICETDTIATDRMLSQVREGDLLVIKNAGAYGFSMSSNYNSRYRPAEVLVYRGQAKLIRERETLDDLLRNQIMVEW